jgi:AraC-like DNA-binding protein
VSADTPEHVEAHTLVLVRRGCFIRVVDGFEEVYDPTVAYCTSPGEEERFAHPHAAGDDCTAITLAPSLAASLWGDEDILPSGPLPTSPGVDLDHRLLLAAARRGANADELVEGAITTAARALECGHPSMAAARPTTTQDVKAVVGGTREALAAKPDLSVLEIARMLGVSPHHLSRIFHRATGHTISRHRMRLRARLALERLAQGERHLARLAADVGFADQSHLCRVIQDETGVLPATLRSMLGSVGPSERKR